MYKQSLIVSGAVRGGARRPRAKPITVLARSPSIPAHPPTHIQFQSIHHTYLYVEVERVVFIVACIE